MPLIRFWLDVESFKSSTQPYPRQRNAVESKPVLGRSVSFDATHLLASRSNETIEVFRVDAFDEDLSADVANANGLPMERDMGDGSSDANSMSNLSDVCERDAVDNGIDDLSMDGMVYEQGRKSATGASSHGDDIDIISEQESTKYAITAPAMPQTPTATATTSTIIDAIHIFKKYLLNGELASLVHIPTEILSRISLALCVQFETGPMQRNGTPIDLSASNESIPFAQLEQTNVASVFDDAQAFVLNHLDATYTAGFLESAFFQRFCSENDGEHMQILDILHNEMALFYFMEFMEIEGKRQYVDFWLGATNFKRQLDPTGVSATATPADAPPIVPMTIEMSQKDALILYDKYFSLQATQPLLLSDQVRYHVEEKICSIDSAASVAHCFDLPLMIVERFLEQRYLQVFRMRSHLFAKYMSEVMRKLDAAKMKMTPERTGRRPSSSISSKNTLLAMESVKKRHALQRIHAASTSDMCIDSRQLHDPDLLWRRNAANSGLSFGRVNAFGRYERNYDMTPFDKINSPTSNGLSNASGTPIATSGDNLDTIIHNTSNKIKRAVRKLVHLPEQSMQEELAWQMAEMIIKDVTSVTLSSNAMTADPIH